MAGILKSLLLLPLIANLVQGHMEMSWPVPFNSKYDSEYYGASVDYSMTSPLRPDGSNYPCKGYHTEGKDKIQAEFVPGGTYNLTLAGSANHLGGSCQLSLSYDNKNFHVIKSMVGGCPLKLNWDFKIPESAPASDSVLFAWTWFNLVGNREMYMNCARVSISNQPIPRYKRAVVNRQASFDSLPDLFACNVGNGCTTIERHEVIFPNPGPVIERGQDAVPVEAGPGFVLSGPPPPGNAFTNTTSPSNESNSTLPAPTGSLNYTTTGYANTSTTMTTTMISTLTSLATTTTSSSFSFSPIGGVFVTVNTTTSTTTTMAANGTGVTTATFTTSSILPLFPMPNATITAGPTGTGTGTSGNIGNSTLTDSRSSNATTTTDFSTITTIIDVISTSTSDSITTTTTTTDSVSSTTASSSSSSALSSSSSSSSSVSGSSSSTSNTASTTTTSNAITTTPTISITVTTTTSSASATFSTINVSGPCTPGAFACNSPTTFSQCVPNTAGTGAYVFMGAVAPGTECRNGAFVRAGSQPCSPVGALLCDGETAFRLCDIGGTVNMGPVAPGTRCVNGVIVAA